AGGAPAGRGGSGGDRLDAVLRGLAALAREGAAAAVGAAVLLLLLLPGLGAAVAAAHREAEAPRIGLQPGAAQRLLEALRIAGEELERFVAVGRDNRVDAAVLGEIEPDLDLAEALRPQLDADVVLALTGRAAHRDGNLLDDGVRHRRRRRDRMGRGRCREGGRGGRRERGEAGLAGIRRA